MQQCPLPCLRIAAQPEPAVAHCAVLALTAAHCLTMRTAARGLLRCPTLFGPSSSLSLSLSLSRSHATQPYDAQCRRLRATSARRQLRLVVTAQGLPLMRHMPHQLPGANDATNAPHINTLCVCPTQSRLVAMVRCRPAHMALRHGMTMAPHDSTCSRIVCARTYNITTLARNNSMYVARPLLTQRGRAVPRRRHTRPASSAMPANLATPRHATHS